MDVSPVLHILYLGMNLRRNIILSIIVTMAKRPKLQLILAAARLPLNAQ